MTPAPPDLTGAIARLTERRPISLWTERTQREEATFHTQLYANYGAGPQTIAWLGDGGRVQTEDGDAWNALTLLFEQEGWSWSLSGRPGSSRAVGLFDGQAQQIAMVVHPFDLTAAALLVYDEALTRLGVQGVHA